MVYLHIARIFFCFSILSDFKRICNRFWQKNASISKIRKCPQNKGRNNAVCRECYCVTLGRVTTSSVSVLTHTATFPASGEGKAVIFYICPKKLMFLDGKLKRACGIGHAKKRKALPFPPAGRVDSRKARRRVRWPCRRNAKPPTGEQAAGRRREKGKEGLLVVGQEVAVFVKLRDIRSLVGHKRHGFRRIAGSRLHRIIADNGVFELRVGIHVLISAEQPGIC